MRNQAIGVAVCAVALAAVSACSTTLPEQSAAPHASRGSFTLVDLDFSNPSLAERFTIRAADPINISKRPDPSYALPHERPAKVAPYAERETSEAIIKRIAEDETKRWTLFDGRGITHEASGLMCPQEINLPEEGRKFSLVEVHAFDQKNLDVGCSYLTGAGAELILYASYWPDMSLEDSAGGSVEAITLRFSVKGRLPVSVADIKMTDAVGAALELEKPEAAAFDIGEINGQPYKTALWIVKTHGWHVKARATYPQQDITAEFVASVMFGFEHAFVFQKNKNDPFSPGNEV